MNKELLEKVGKNIKKYRDIKDFTQLRLSMKSGIAPSTIGAIETAYNDISLSKLNAIAEGLGITLAELVTFEE